MDTPDRKDDEVVQESYTHLVLDSFGDPTPEQLQQALQAAADHPMDHKYIIVTGSVRTDWSNDARYALDKFTACAQTGLWSWGVLIKKQSDNK